MKNNDEGSWEPLNPNSDVDLEVSTTEQPLVEVATDQERHNDVCNTPWEENIDSF